MLANAKGAPSRITAGTARVERLILCVLILLNRAGWHRRLSVVAVAVAVVLLRLALLPAIPIPHPWVVDEFSYLLAADTFAAGRLANPTPHHWRSFEAVNVIVQPTYASKYPPGQGAFLAVGQVVFGNPYWGVVLSTALFCAAVCWMLQGVVSPGWAIAGAILSFALFGTNHYWMQSYWGGSVTGFGGCLITGSALRMLRNVRPERYVWPFCAGVPFLLFTRPFEGSVLLVTVSALLAIKLLRETDGIGIRRLIAPCLMAGAGVIVFQAYYDWRITGSPFVMPYTTHEQTYKPVPSFWFLPLRTNVQRPTDPVMYAFHWGQELPPYNEIREMPVWRRIKETINRGFWMLAITFGAWMYVLWMVPVFWSDPRVRFLAVIIGAAILGSSLAVGGMQHYLAPSIPALIALIVLVFQKLRTLETRGGIRLGTLMTGMVLLIIAVFAFEHRPNPRLVGPPISRVESTVKNTVPHELSATPRNRADLMKVLERSGEKHVIIVHCSHPLLVDWVHNGANIDAQTVIWARDRGADENRALISYYSGRRIWAMRQSEGETFTFGPYVEDDAAYRSPAGSTK
jgi:hypothetical protein